MSDLMKLLSYLLNLSRDLRFPKLTVALIILSGLLSGLAAAGLIGVINTFLGNPDVDPKILIWSFWGLALTLPLITFLARYLVILLTQQAFFTLRTHLCRQILVTPLRRLEELGAARLLASLAGDVGQISQSVGSLPILVMNVAVVFGCGVYLGWVSWSLLLQMMVVAILGAVTFRPALKRANVNYTRTRELYAELFEHFRGLTEGTKELKMHRARRRSFNELVESTSREHRAQVRSADTLLTGLSSWAEFLFFFAIGLLLFAASSIQSLELEVKLAFAVTILLLRGPIEDILNRFPMLARAAVAIRKVEEISEQLREPPSNEAEPVDSEGPGQFKKIELAGVTHTYFREDKDEKFQLGPLSFTIRPGELIFLVGGNGSGKTTLAKILVGLYTPESGEIRLDGVPVVEENRDDYRQLFSVVFSDFFIFDRLLGLETAREEEGELYLDRLQLQKKVTIRDGRLSTVDLSQGQRKRLALLTAYLEDREIYLFDEWAADQDPQFKGTFYLELLPALRARGKTVIVISHDDHYYHVADRVLKLDYGLIDFDGNLEDYLRFAPPRAQQITAGEPAQAGGGQPS